MSDQYIIQYLVVQQFFCGKAAIFDVSASDRGLTGGGPLVSDDDEKQWLKIH